MIQLCALLAFQHYNHEWQSIFFAMMVMGWVIESGKIFEPNFSCKKILESQAMILVLYRGPFDYNVYL